MARKPVCRHVTAQHNAVALKVTHASNPVSATRDVGRAHPVPMAGDVTRPRSTVSRHATLPAAPQAKFAVTTVPVRILPARPAAVDRAWSAHPTANAFPMSPADPAQARDRRAVICPLKTVLVQPHTALSCSRLNPRTVRATPTTHSMVKAGTTNGAVMPDGT